MAFGLLAPSTAALAFQEDGLSTAPPVTTYDEPSGAEINPDDTVYDPGASDTTTSNNPALSSDTTTNDPAFNSTAFDNTGPDNTGPDNTGPDNTVYDDSSVGDPCDPEIYAEAASDPFCSGVTTTVASVPTSSTANRFTDALASLSTDDTPLAELGSDDAQVIGAGRMLLAIDAIAELGGFERAVTPGGAVLLRDIREDILAAGLNEAGYTQELEEFVTDFIPFLESLEADGVTVSPDLWDAAAGLEAVLFGNTNSSADLGLLEPQPWLLGIADLLVRGGVRPSTPDLEGDEQAIRELLAAFALTPVESTTTTTAPEEDTPPPSVLPLETDPEVVTAETSDLPTLLAAGGVAAAFLVGLVVFLRRRRPKRRPATGPSALHPETGHTSTTPAANNEPAASKASVTELLDASRRMSASLDAPTIASIALAEAKRIVGAEGGIVVRRTDEGLDPVGCEPPMLFNYEHIGDGCLPRVVETGQSTAAITHDEPLLVEVPMAMGAVPIVTDGVITGAILVVRISAKPFDRDELDALEMLAPLVGSAFAVADTHGTAVDVEPLTGLQNRRRLDLDLASISTEEEVAYVMVDIDHFKNFNDTNGHAAGDEALRQVSALLQASVRPNDLVYRYGGEEFCVLLPATTAQEAAVVAERARAAVESAEIPGMENQPAGKVTISIGVSDSAFGTPEDLVERADAALYVSKRNGRNQVTLSPTD